MCTHKRPSLDIKIQAGPWPSIATLDIQKIRKLKSIYGSSPVSSLCKACVRLQIDVHNICDYIDRKT